LHDVFFFKTDRFRSGTTYETPYEKTNRSIPRIITFELNDNPIKILFIKHPSKYFSWDKWAKIISNEIDLSVFSLTKNT